MVFGEWSRRGQRSHLCLCFQPFSCARLCLQGSMCKDFLVNYFCLCCATCQLKRDINRRKEQNIFWAIHFSFFLNSSILVPEQQWHPSVFEDDLKLPAVISNSVIMNMKKTKTFPLETQKMILNSNCEEQKSAKVLFFGVNSFLV